MKILGSPRRFLLAPLVLTATLLAGATSRVLGDCGPFTDVSFFCSPILELYYLGITGGTSPTTYAPDQTTTRGEIAAFIARSFNQSIKRSSRRAALGQWWTPQEVQSVSLTKIGNSPYLLQSDGADVWIANTSDGTVSRVHVSDGRVLETWTGATSASGVLVAMGRVFVTGSTNPGAVYRIDPSQPASNVELVATLPDTPYGIAFDGSKIWVGNATGPISIITPGSTLPWSVTSAPSSGFGLLYDGASIWAAEFYGPHLLKLDSSGAVIQTVPVGDHPQFPAFDGANIWVPNSGDNTVSVVRASTGATLETLTGNGLNHPVVAAFDGERILVTNQDGDSVSLWRAADLASLGSFSVGPGSMPFGVCSDGQNFWIALGAKGQLARF